MSKNSLTVLLLTVIILMFFTDRSNRRKSTSATAETDGLVAMQDAFVEAEVVEPISQYDNLIRQVCENEGLDWRFISAIAYHESRFKANIVSNKGAKGLMQIMPVVARQFGVASEEVIKPEVNVMLAAKLIKRIDEMLSLSPNTPKTDRMSIILAAYNAGVGHVADARRLTSKYGGNPNSWEDVSYYLRLKSNPDYYCDRVVRSGSFHGSGQTLAFVDNVIGKYNGYCLIARK